jgi:chromosome segregation ATPase
VEVDIGLNAYANARAHYEARRKRLDKHAKTLEANRSAFKAAEKKAEKQLSQVQRVQAAHGGGLERAAGFCGPLGAQRR